MSSSLTMRRTLCRRSLSSTSTAAATSTANTPTSTPATPAPHQHQQQHQSSSTGNRISIALLIKRSPLILKKLSPFEHAYLKYKNDVAAASSTRPFNHNFYFKKGSTVEINWVQAQKALSEKNNQLSSLSRPCPYVTRDCDQELSLAIEKLADSVTESDKMLMEMEAAAANEDKNMEEKRDQVRSTLDRLYDETLYLVVKNTNGKHGSQWTLPSGSIAESELLHEAAERHVEEQLGQDIKTWAVGRAPVGHYINTQDNSKTFVMKQLVLSGQVAKTNNKNLEWMWLSPSEMQKSLSPDVWSQVKDMV